MKIHMYGGVLNISYNLAKLLRRKGQDVTLFIDERPGDRSYAPAWEDEELSGGYPAWIRPTGASFPKALMGDRRSRRFAKELADCDVLHIHGESYLWANLFDKRFILHIYGYDLDQMPFRRDSLKTAAIAYLSRRGIRRSGRILISPHQKIFLKRLGIADKGGYLPFPVDIDKYSRTDAASLRRGLLGSGNAEYIFFHPSRHEWKNNLTTNNKGNDKVLVAFASYLKMRPGKAILVLVNKGRDVAETRNLADELGVGGSTIWLDPMPKAKLIEYYSAADIVLDQFTLGGFGQIFLESMACGRPTFIYLKGYESAYREIPPAVNVSSVEEIADNLRVLTDDRRRLDDLGKRSREWMQRYHHWPVACDSFIDLYKSFMGDN